jgi:hypothetical protein
LGAGLDLAVGRDVEADLGEHGGGFEAVRVAVAVPPGWTVPVRPVRTISSTVNQS